MSDKKQPIKQPVCQHFKEVIRAVKYVGYYDEFYFWECGCYELPDAKEQRGQYA